MLDHLTPDTVVPASLYERIDALDAWLWQERASFLVVVGEQVLQHARREERSPRSHWWWYLDAIVAGEMKIEFNEETGVYEGLLRKVSGAGALPDSKIESRRF
jgi:hypothetical protein